MKSLNNRNEDLKAIKELAKKIGNKELEADVKKRIKNGNTVNKWQK